MVSNITICINKNAKTVEYDTNLNSCRIDNVEVFEWGIFYNELGEMASLSDLFDAYIKYGTKLYNFLDGSGTVIVLDHNKNRLYAFTDYFNSILPLFYAEDRSNIILATDMLGISGRIGELSISQRAANEFILHGMNFGKRTLIKQIHKLPAKHYLEIDLNRCKLYCKKCQYTFERLSDVSMEDYNSCFSKCVEECYIKDAAMTLSGGFDTNFIMHYLEKIKKEKNDLEMIQSYCGGGIEGKDETPLVKEMAADYGNIHLHTFYVDQDTIQHYPEIVLALQGTCFEDGIFLHYLMAKMFYEDGIKYVYTGDLADQVLNLESFRYTRSTYKRIIKMSFRGVKNALRHKKYDHYNWVFRGRYETGALKNLKKGGLLWGHFGAAGIYPYLRRPFLTIAQNVIAPGDYSKLFHRKVVLNTVDPNIAQKIKRNGGNTDPIALFDEQTKEAIRTEIRKMPWYKDRSYVNEDQQLGYELRILFVDLVRRVFINRELGEHNIGNYPLLGDLYPTFKR